MRQILLIMALFICTMMNAAPVSKEEAQQKAANFMAAKTGMQITLKAAQSGTRRAASAQQEPFYVFNREGGGYVIVSGDDRTDDILGYSLTGTFDAANLPTNMRSFLQEYADGIQYLIDNDVQIIHHIAKKARRASVGASISPILQRHWDQDSPYNKMCPTVDGTRTVTGCVATAMAQIMGHHNWPAATTTEIPSYTTYTNKITLDAIPAGTAIDWENIRDSYNYGYTTAQSDAIANLMKLCGYSVQMNYDTSENGGSGADDAAVITALVKYFDYEEETCRHLLRENYSYAEWQSIIYKELQENRPVLYAGQSAGGGHAFVVDGYQSDDFFHINWGWGGYQDNYFRLRLLNPDDQGIDGSTTNDGYAIGQGCGIGIKPNDGVYTSPTPNLTYYSIDYPEQTEYTRISTTRNFNVNKALTYYLLNKSGDEYTFAVGVRITNEAGNTVLESKLYDTTLPNNYYTNHDYLPQFGANWANGKYKIVFLSREVSAIAWNVCEHAESHPIEFTISGNKLTFTNIPVYDLAVTASEVDGTLEANTEHTIRVTVKNNGSTLRSDVYAIVNPGDNYDETGECDDDIPVTFLDLENGEGTTFEFKYTPEKNGSNYIYLVCEKGQIGDPIVLEITGGINLKYVSQEATNAMLHHDSEQDVDYIYGKTISSKITIENNGEKEFKGKIMVYVYGLYEGDYYQLNGSAKTFNMTIAPKTFGNFTMTFNGGDWETWYGITQFAFDLYYQEDGKDNSIFLTSLPDFQIREMPVNIKLKDPFIANFDEITGYISGYNFSFTSMLTNSGKGDFDGHIDVTVYEYLPSSGWTSETIPVPYTLAAGESKEFTYEFENPKHEPDAIFYLDITYTYDDEFSRLHISDKGIFIDNSGIEEVMFSGNGKPNKVYNLQGRQVGMSTDFNTLQPGIYIVGGKKLMKR